MLTTAATPSAAGAPHPGRELAEKLRMLSETLPSDQREALDTLVFKGLSAHDQLALVPPEALLSPSELADFNQAEERAQARAEISVSSLVVILKATRRCNLRCTYCRAWRPDDSADMSFGVLADICAQVLSLPGLRHVEFIWHGGEVTLLDRSFFLKAMVLQARFRRHGTQITNSIQTNGVRISGSLLDLYAHFGFSIGVSVDAPRVLQDSLRQNKAGRPTWERVRRTLTTLKERRLPLALLCVVGPQTRKLGARALLESLAELGIPNIGLLNMVPENGREAAAGPQDLIEWQDYLDFMAEVYTLWQEDYSQLMVLRELDDLHRAVQGGATSLCYFTQNCAAHYLTFEPDGHVASCDKYVGLQDHRFGSVAAGSLADILATSSNLAKARAGMDAENETMSRCKWFALCKGGCPHDRRLTRLRGTAWPDCCGYGPLLDHISSSLEKRSNLPERTGQ